MVQLVHHDFWNKWKKRNEKWVLTYHTWPTALSLAGMAYGYLHNLQSFLLFCIDRLRLEVFAKRNIKRIYLCVVDNSFKPVVQLDKVFFECLGFQPWFPGVLDKILVQCQFPFQLASGTNLQVSRYIVNVAIAAEGTQRARKRLGFRCQTVKWKFHRLKKTLIRSLEHLWNSGRFKCSAFTLQYFNPVYQEAPIEHLPICHTVLVALKSTPWVYWFVINLCSWF